MKRRIAGWLMMAFTVAAVAGCSKPGLTGAWTGSINAQGNTATITLSFTSDGKFTQTTSAPTLRPPLVMVSSGSYTTKDGSLTMTPLSASINGVQRSMRSATAVSCTYKIDGDKLTMTDSGGVQSTTLTRAKK
jgi:hypothetical protein